MRISDWSSDVCSSDLAADRALAQAGPAGEEEEDDENGEKELNRRRRRRRDEIVDDRGRRRRRQCLRRRLTAAGNRGEGAVDEALQRRIEIDERRQIALNAREDRKRVGEGKRG